jgi:hypothetical protein
MSIRATCVHQTGSRSPLGSLRSPERRLSARSVSPTLSPGRATKHTLSKRWLAVIPISTVLALLGSVSTIYYSDKPIVGILDAIGSGGLLIVFVGASLGSAFGTRTLRLAERVRQALPKVLTCLGPATVVLAAANVYVPLSWRHVLGMPETLARATRGVAQAAGFLAGVLVFWLLLCVVAHVAQWAADSSGRRNVGGDDGDVAHAG